jgi:hypothetical protein
MQSEQNSEPTYHINSLHLDTFLKRITGDDGINSIGVMHALDNSGELTLDHIHLMNIQENHLIFNEHGLKYDNALKSYTLLPKNIADAYVSKAFKINHYLIEDARTGNVYQLSALNEQSKNRYKDTGSYALHVATWGKGNQNKAEIQGLLETYGWNIDEDDYHSTPEIKFFKSYHEKKEFKPAPPSPKIPVRKDVVKKEDPLKYPFENKLSVDDIQPHSLAVTFISNQLSFLDQAQRMDSSKENKLLYRTYYDFVTRALVSGKKDLSFKIDKDELASITKIISILTNKGALTKHRDTYKITGRIAHSALAIKEYALMIKII